MDYNSTRVGYWDARRLVIFVRDEQDQIIAGLSGWTYLGWLAVDLLWVHSDWRGQQIGAQLLSNAEKEARERGCRQVLLDTFSFQAPGFYQKQGYEIFGILDGFAGQHQRIYLRKTLA